MKLYLTGGFLGSGKTTAILQAALHLQKEGKKVGVVTNDQGEQLVDTRFMEQNNIAVEEVKGSCFCCNFHELAKSIQSLTDRCHPDLIFAESTGSCTDLVATVLKPLRQFHGNTDIVLSVFADIRLLGVYLQRNKNIFGGKMNYVYEKQLEEADIIVVNKTDTLNEIQMKTTRELINKEPWAERILYQNSLEPGDIHTWLETMDKFRAPLTRRSLVVDYDAYAMGEAEMAWYDSEVEIITADGSAGEKAYRLIAFIYDKITGAQHVIGHLKFLLYDEATHAKVSFTTLPGVEDRDAGPFPHADSLSLIINARVKADIEALDRIISGGLFAVASSEGCAIHEKNKKVFQPRYPRPTYRL